VIDFEPYYLTTTKVSMINSEIQIIKPIMVSYANKVLDDGLNLPFPEDIIKYMKNESIKMYD
jgi:hypothetical protein